jgi:tRNA-specific 2-thiouridylase
MSGGVDSSMAAALLVEQGYEVIGIMLRLWADDSAGEPVENRCCSLQAMDDARRVAARLGIPFYLINAEAPFKSIVVDYFTAEYAAGRTPNPCLRCNRLIRFGFLLERALALEADCLATGHYARVRQRDGCFELLKGVDRRKDQSYALAMLTQSQLAHALFPLGELTKAEVRRLARERGLPVAERPESQELCFLGDGNYRGFLARHAARSLIPGPILDLEGRELGQHRGLPLYTIGQRKGLGIAVGEPRYVVAMDTARNALIVGPPAALLRRSLVAHEMNWIAGRPPQGPIRVTAKIRYRAPDRPATATPLDDDRVQVAFDEPQRAITPGQAVVLYQGDVCLGGGIIAAAHEPGDAP